MKFKLFALILFCILILTACTQNNSTTLHQFDEQTKPNIDQLDTTSNEIEANLDNMDDQSLAYDHEKDDQSISNPSSDSSPLPTITEPEEYDYVLTFPSDKYPETALHILGAIEQGHSDVCTIDREGADDNRKESLKGIPTMDGYDRDEWPMAMCEEGGKGASVAYISASDNRGAGSWVGNELSQYENGERILFIVEKPKQLFPNQSQSNQDLIQADQTEADIVFNSCAEAKAANAAPIKIGEPGYSKKLDRDGDGIACEI